MHGVRCFHIGNDCKNLIDKFLKFGLMDRDFHLTNLDNRKTGLSKMVNKYLA